MNNKLITKDLIQKLPKLYSQEQVQDPLCIAKFFTPDAQWTWYVIEGEIQQWEGKEGILFFGFIVGQEAELGYFQLSELEAARGQLGLPIERDTTFHPMLLSQIKKKHLLP